MTNPEKPESSQSHEAEAGNKAEDPLPGTEAHAHNHFCAVCLQPVAHCGAGGSCQHPDPQYCSVHHPDPEYRAEDKPVIRMHVKLAE